MDDSWGNAHGDASLFGKHEPPCCRGRALRHAEFGTLLHLWTQVHRRLLLT